MNNPHPSRAGVKEIVDLYPFWVFISCSRAKFTFLPIYRKNCLSINKIFTIMFFSYFMFRIRFEISSFKRQMTTSFFLYPFLFLLVSSSSLSSFNSKTDCFKHVPKFKNSLNLFFSLLYYFFHVFCHMQLHKQADANFAIILFLQHICNLFAIQLLFL